MAPRPTREHEIPDAKIVEHKPLDALAEKLAHAPFERQKLCATQDLRPYGAQLLGLRLYTGQDTPSPPSA
jgi:hypothetical protein